MHVDWDWIRQRPHHLAEGLAARHDVEVLYPRSWRRSTLVSNRSTVSRRALVPLPLRRRIQLVAHADAALQRRRIAAAIERFRPDVVWVTHPRLEPLLPDPLPPRAALVYDCMDDAAEFPDTSVERSGLLAAEVRLAHRAALTLASSARLAGVLAARGFAPECVEIVRNAGAVPDGVVPPAAPRAPGAPLRAAYFGTVSEWLDVPAILAALDALPELRIDLVGPLELPAPRHPRLRCLGPVQHEDLLALAAAADVLLVPFRRTPLVECVDPVKLYEYVAFGRDVVCLRWPEVERFAPFAHLYEGAEQLVTILGQLARCELRGGATREERATFLRRNRWTDRVAQIEAAIDRAMARWGNAA
jgi:glycosyltransferase involved in cell wall biosynthesis